MKTIDIKGKQYVPVSERLKAAHEKDISSIITTYEYFKDEQMFVVQALIEIDGKNFTGTAQEVVGQTQITRTKALEKCETTAVGRALAMAGFGIDSAIASADEVADNLKGASASDSQKQYIVNLLDTAALTDEMIDDIMGSLDTFSYARAKECIAHLKDNQRDPENPSKAEINGMVADKLADEKA